MGFCTVLYSTVLYQGVGHSARFMDCDAFLTGRPLLLRRHLGSLKIVKN